ncbi:hypothetical protein NBRC116584_13270 [Hydrogenophaga sp. 5NK40-0174]
MQARTARALGTMSDFAARLQPKVTVMCAPRRNEPRSGSKDPRDQYSPAPDLRCVAPAGGQGTPN